MWYEPVNVRHPVSAWNWPIPVLHETLIKDFTKGRESIQMRSSGKCLKFTEGNEAGHADLVGYRLAEGRSSSVWKANVQRWNYSRVVGLPGTSPVELTCWRSLHRRDSGSWFSMIALLSPKTTVQSVLNGKYQRPVSPISSMVFIFPLSAAVIIEPSP